MIKAELDVRRVVTRQKAGVAVILMVREARSVMVWGWRGGVAANLQVRLKRQGYPKEVTEKREIDEDDAQTIRS